MANLYGGILTEVFHPFGRGALTSTGAQYSTMVSTAGSTSYITVEEVTIPMATNAMLKEVEFGLTVGLGISVTTDSPKVKYLIKDDAQTSYDTLIEFTSTTLAAQASTGTTVYDFTCAGMKTPSDGTYFTGKGTFQIACQVAANASTSNARGETKNSSYVSYQYHLVA